MDKEKFLARPGQLLKDHLFGVAEKTKKRAKKIGLPLQGELIGLLHDFGKYSSLFQQYLLSAIGALDPDTGDSYVDTSGLKGKIDHSTAGAQWVWEQFQKYGRQGKLVAQIFAVCIASHHSGLIDCLKPDDDCPEGDSALIKRIKKEDKKTNYKECCKNGDEIVIEKASELAVKSLVVNTFEKIKEIIDSGDNEKIQRFYLGLMVRFLFSCLIDSDRLDSASVESPQYIEINDREVDWSIAIDRFKKRIVEFKNQHPIDILRREISNNCRERAFGEQGIYTLTVPTGGGKTLASLRYAMHHAKHHGLDKIIYVIPYTSIIEQNAQAIRDVIEDDADLYPWVLEHHSNLDPEKETQHSKFAPENWNAPIIVTTMVQFLEVLFGGGTRSVRRLHQLANSVIIFDEIQTLPIKCVHIFCNAINYITRHAKTTAVLCTATQPLLNELRIPKNGQLTIPKENELAKNVVQLFDDLKRVDIINQYKQGGWRIEEVVELVLSQFYGKGNCLVVVNTKKSARMLYQLCKGKIPEEALFHLSTNQYPVHRKEFLGKIKERLNKKLPVLCISTQLIEAGVDIDFSAVIRFLAGLDSIVQAAGRCNRHGALQDENGNTINGQVHVINPDFEKVEGLEDINIGQQCARRIFEELEKLKISELNPTPEILSRYFQYYFFDRYKEMSYNVSKKEVGYDTTLLDLLAGDEKLSHYQHDFGRVQQSFMTAGRIFAAIDAPTKAIIIQHGAGANIVSKLCRVAKKFNPAEYRRLLREAQRYTVNVSPNDFNKLKKQGAIYEISEEGIFYLDERFYDADLGLCEEPVGVMSALIAE